MKIDKRQLIEALVEFLGDEGWAEIRKVVDKTIALQDHRLKKLKELSTQLSQDSRAEGADETRGSSDSGDDDNLSAADGIYQILKTAGRPLAVADIRVRFANKYNRDIQTSYLGNVLWKNKNKRFVKTGGTRWAKWKLKKE